MTIKESGREKKRSFIPGSNEQDITSSISYSIPPGNFVPPAHSECCTY